MTSAPTRPHWRKPWQIVVVLHLLSLFGGSIATSKGVFFPSLVTAFGLSHTTGSTLLSINLVVGGFVSLFGGWLMVRNVSAQLFLTITTVLIGIGYLVAGAASSAGMLLFAYVLMAGGSAHLVAIPFVITNWFKDRGGLALGAAMAGSTTCGVVLNPILAAIVTHYGWRAGYFTLGGLILVLMPVLLMTVVRSTPPGEKRADHGGAAAAKLTGMTLRQALATRRYWLILFGYTVFWATSGAYFLHFIAAVEGVGLTATGAASVMSILFLLAAATKLGFGYFADRTDIRLALSVSLCLAAVGMLILQQFVGSGAGIWLTLFVPVYGLSYSAPLVLFPVLTARCFGRRHFTVIDATIMVTGSIVGSLGGVFAGKVFDVTNSYRLAFIVFAVLLAAAGLLVQWTRGARPAVAGAAVG